ncbi:MAG TPA: TusE/DsrC/DsvC family sulfur relay protein [Caldithrix abyssi]|uniref:TusE/DsrC/DsvC family sulfur relay protein n=1 Tax=Caldithrix abyssi TaxID=187145 RepID=A0A7V4TYP3_CALAY|nr:TusE/DsrC/DsvC family sulfur relay protein [Caldithrix abyssi]
MAEKTLAGKTVQVDDEGFLVNPDDWTEDMAPELAKEIGIDELTDKHWEVIRFMRKDFAEKGQIPSIRRMKNAGGIPTKDLYAMFPEGPAKKAAYIAGLGKPHGCV